MAIRKKNNKNISSSDSYISACKNLGHNSPIMEAYRILRTNIEFSSTLRKIQVLLVTSAMPSEGKSTTVANLARTFAFGGTKTLVMDLDLRRPVQHKIHSLDNNAGITEILIGKASPAEVIQPTDTENLYVLSCGYRPPNPAELLSSTQLSELVSELRGSFDMILMDTPPAATLADAAILTKVADASILVVSAGRTELGDVDIALENLRRTGTNILGTVLNNVTKQSKSYKYKYYYNY